MKRTVLPGGKIGILGGGQLGLMLAESAQRMGYRVHIFSPQADCPAAKAANSVTVADFSDRDALVEFVHKIEVATLEWENVPVSTLELLEKYDVQVYPGPDVLKVTQHRLREKTFLLNAGFPVTPFLGVASMDDLKAGVEKLGVPAVLKTVTMGYDGKGQVIIYSHEQLYGSKDFVSGREWILEKFVDFETECSIIAARGQDGSFAHFPLIENFHRNGILDISICPAKSLSDIEKQAVGLAKGIMEALGMVGVMGIEFFVTPDHDLLVNELAPRVHNSGHLTMDACKSSQFDLHIRAVCGFPLGDCALKQPAAMANLLGNLWVEGKEPDWSRLDKYPDIRLYLYGKEEARPGRKMGHLAMTGPDLRRCLNTVMDAREALLD